MKATLITLLTLGSLAMAETENILDKALYKLVVDDTTTDTISLANLGKSGSFTLTMQLNDEAVLKFLTYVGSTTTAAGNPTLVSLEAGSNYVGTAFGYSSTAGTITDGGIFLTSRTSSPTTSGGNYQDTTNYLKNMDEESKMFGLNVTLTIVHTDKTGTDMYGILFSGLPQLDPWETTFTQISTKLKWSTGLGDWTNLHVNTDLVSKVALYEGVLQTDQIAASNRAILTMQNVPEPATGTLSLLALAGLAARRRRK